MIFDGSISGEGTAREFFTGNGFYTTPCERMSRGILEGTLFPEEVAQAVIRHSDIMQNDIRNITQAKEPEPDRFCAYAPAITAAIPPDPSAQPETLGDDLLASSAAGLGNCRALLTLDGLDDHRLGLLRKQYYRYLTLALSNIGGAVRGTPVPWRKQKETLAFVLRGLAAAPSELADPAAEKRIQDELEGHFLPERIQQTCGEKALKRYFRTLRRLRNRYKTHYPTIY